MKVKVNRVRGGSMGDQRNYGLVTGSIWNYEDKPSSNQVGDTMSAVPRDEATIEAERGETIVGDLDNDGMLEHVIVGGKRHFQGGTPLNVPDGSFVYSDTRALRIKNKDVLKGIFNMSASGGVTPAKVAKRYDLNQYKDLLMDPESDFLTKKTAQMMIDNNVKKLGQLALIQEGMKGFPDGIPNIALPLFANDIAVSQPSEQPQQMMRKGGLVKYQGGRQVGKLRKGDRFPEVPVRDEQAELKEIQQLLQNNPGILLPEATVMSNYPYLYEGFRPGQESIEDYIARVESDPNFINWARRTGEGIFDVETSPNYLPGYYPNVKQEVIGGAPPEWFWPTVGGAAPFIGPLAAKSTMKLLEKIAPTIKRLKPWQWPAAVWRGLKNVPYIGPTVRAGVKGGIGAGTGVLINKFAGIEDLPVVPPQPIPQGSRANIAADMTDSSMVNTNLPAPRDTTSQAARDTSGTRIVIDPNTGSSRYETEVDSSQLKYESNKYGGVPKYQNAGEKFTVYRPESQIKSSDQWRVVPSAQKIPYKFRTQAFDPNLGIYTIKDPNTGKNIPLDLNDLYKRIESTEKATGMPWVSNYGTGMDQFKQDLVSKDPKVREAATEHLQTQYDVIRKQLGLPSYYYGEKNKANPYKIDKKLGVYTFSSPGLEKLPQVVPAAGGQDQEPVAGTTMKGIPATQYSSGMYDSPWSNYSLVDLGAGLSNYYNIDRGPLPLKQRFIPYLPDATFMDPARPADQVRGVTRGTQEAIMSASEPTVGRVNAIAAQATAAPQVADIIAKYDQANVGIANQMESARGQIMNEAELRNLGLDKQYVDELTTLEQQYQNALAEGRTEVAESIKRGMADAMYRAGINLENPNYAIDPLTGRYYFKPGFNPATGTNIFASATRTGTGAVAAIQEIMQQLGISATEAAQVYRASMGAGRNAVSNPADIMWNPNVV